MIPKHYAEDGHFPHPDPHPVMDDPIVNPDEEDSAAAHIRLEDELRQKEAEARENELVIREAEAAEND